MQHLYNTVHILVTVLTIVSFLYILIERRKYLWELYNQLKVQLTSRLSVYLIADFVCRSSMLEMYLKN